MLLKKATTKKQYKKQYQKSKSKTTPKRKKSKTTPKRKKTIPNNNKNNNNIQQNKEHQHQNILNLIAKFTESKQNFNKSRNNLPAKLMKINNMKTVNNMHKTQSYAKSISSSYSSVMKNGITHSSGKEIINESTKPYIRINEMHNGHIDKYMVPKNTIPYIPISSTTSTTVNTNTSNTHKFKYKNKQNSKTKRQYYKRKYTKK